MVHAMESTNIARDDDATVQEHCRKDNSNDKVMIFLCQLFGKSMNINTGVEILLYPILQLPLDTWIPLYT